VVAEHGHVPVCLLDAGRCLGGGAGVEDVRHRGSPVRCGWGVAGCSSGRAYAGTHGGVPAGVQRDHGGVGVHGVDRLGPVVVGGGDLGQRAEVELGDLPGHGERHVVPPGDAVGRGQVVRGDVAQPLVDDDGRVLHALGAFGQDVHAGVGELDELLQVDADAVRDGDVAVLPRLA